MQHAGVDYQITYTDIDTPSVPYSPQLLRDQPMSQQQQPPYKVAYSQPLPLPPPQPTNSRKRGHHDDLEDDLQPTLEQQYLPYSQSAGSISLHAQDYSLQHYTTSMVSQPVLPPTHHHHLPSQHRSKRPHLTEDSPPSPVLQGPPNVVGQQGMPLPAQRPRGPKLKFTQEDDQLLLDLKEKKNLTWKQIADFFPGRSSGTLQVRYCTKLKAKATVWTDDMVVKLRNAMQEYENDRWRIISSKVGNGFSPAACRDKASEMEAGDLDQEEQTHEDEDKHQSQPHLQHTSHQDDYITTSHSDYVSSSRYVIGHHDHSDGYQ